ncbi:hypothetical protein G7Z17_g11221 [Cylindrodendrum hubeiense]|uniref:F-box domain-containing protein n=1 Tax=Cylindrodendrum hubeiense TaxID=595255 RepID=A0A9P5L6K0_9HYPO|nr:hypothetical protein G7Z17_g11221 [Cylindrodendrum hubeiense]
MASSNLIQIPSELLATVLASLSNRDIKNLRLTCKFFLSRACLRINRVFLSPNPHNIEVFRAIADHETYSKGIVEIIWDDAWLGQPWKQPDGYGEDYDDDYGAPPPPDDVPDWWWRECKESLKTTSDRKAHDVERLEHIATQKQINARMSPAESYAYWQKLKQQQDKVVTLGFRRIDLDFIIAMQEHNGWEAFRSGCLRSALAEATDLDHISLQTDMDEVESYIDNFIPLGTLFPIAQWPRLCHFRLSQFPVKQDDLLGLLATLPPTLRSVELSCLEFLNDSGNYRDLLTAMRDTLGWQDRPLKQRPKISICIEGDRAFARGVWVDKEVNAFFYESSENPFTCSNGNQVEFGEVGVWKDAFDPGWERPHTDGIELMRMGVIVKDRWLMGESPTMRSTDMGYIIPEDLQV